MGTLLARSVVGNHHTEEVALDHTCFDLGILQVTGWESSAVGIEATPLSP